MLSVVFCTILFSPFIYTLLFLSSFSTFLATSCYYINLVRSVLYSGMASVEAGESSSSAVVGGERSAAPPQVAEQLPCPRCQSTDTKFCYYNNYNFSQPRYFCKSCRRYWTRGGALRDVPVGGGSRKSAKRSRTASPSSSAVSTTTSTTSSAVSTAAIPAMPVYSSQFSGGVGVGVGGGGFTSLLALGGFGFGLGLGLDEGRCGYGFGNSGWVLPESGYVSGNCGGGDGDGGDDGVCVSSGGATWHVEGGGGGEGVGDYFSSLPELAISTPGNVLK